MKGKGACQASVWKCYILGENAMPSSWLILWVPGPNLHTIVFVSHFTSYSAVRRDVHKIISTNRPKNSLNAQNRLEALKLPTLPSNFALCLYRGLE